MTEAKKESDPFVEPPADTLDSLSCDSSLTSPAGGRMGERATRAAAMLVVVLSVFGCEKRTAPGRQEVGTGATGPGSAMLLPPPAPFDEVLVPEGAVDNGDFTLEFRIHRVGDDAGKTYLQAVDNCRKGGRMLCTETQWMRACALHPEIGRMEAWTATRRGREAVVRGGEDCARRLKVADDVVEPRRVGLCCERAVALRAAPDSGPWLGIGARLPREFERALNENDPTTLRRILADPVVRESQPWTLEALLAKESEVAASGAVAWTLFDSCQMRGGPVVVDKQGEKTGRVQGIILSCRTVLARGEEVLDYDTRLGLREADGEAGYRVSQIEHKSKANIPGAR